MAANTLTTQPSTSKLSVNPADYILSVKFVSNRLKPLYYATQSMWAVTLKF